MPAFTRFFDEPLTYVRVAMNTRGEKGAEKKGEAYRPFVSPWGANGLQAVVTPPLGADPLGR
jgi:hypothetical protein